MKITRAFATQSLIALVFAGAGAAGVTIALQPEAPKQDPGGHGQPDMDQMMQQWMESQKPGKAHETLHKSVGNWNCVIKMMMPGMPPSESKGKATIKSVLGGKFVLQEFEGDMMGMPMTGMGLTGFDNNRKVFVGTWADSFGTSIAHMTGGQSPDGKIQTMFGTIDEPMTGEIGKTVKYVTRHIDDNTMVFEAWEVMYGNDFKAFEIHYTRAK